MEAAFLIPIALTGLLIAAQPAIVLYDRLVMEATASEACRLLETLPEGEEDTALDYIERRLEAIPDIDIFHASEWDIELSGNASTQVVSVRITNSLSPLPLISAGMGFLGMTNSSGLYEHEAYREASMHDDWEASSEFGLDTESWIERWEEKA